MRFGLGAAATALLLTCQTAEAAERGKAWDDLIAEARARGAVETKLDRSASYVFTREDGSFVTFTRLLDRDKGRSICLIAKDEMATACVDWETGKLTLGSRADAATPWSFKSHDSLDAFEAAQPGLLDRFGSLLGSLLTFKGRRPAHGNWVLSRYGNWYWKSDRWR